jgi:hypothetical protein
MMDAAVSETLPYQDGYLTLTETHLFVVRGGYLVETLALRHLSGITAGQAQSFRHPLLGLLAAGLLLGPSLALLLPGNIAVNIAVLAFLRGRVGGGVLFAAFFGILFLWGVVTSRRIWWLHLRYSGVRKTLPLPGAEPQRIERFLQSVRGQMGGVKENKGA